jgi:hypothetical protein
MKKQVDKKPKSIEDLKKVLLDVWNNLDDRTINGLIDSMPRRLSEVIHTGGEAIIKIPSI